jgi:hypothetical protein
MERLAETGPNPIAGQIVELETMKRYLEPGIHALQQANCSRQIKGAVDRVPVVEDRSDLTVRVELFPRILMKYAELNPALPRRFCPLS